MYSYLSLRLDNFIYKLTCLCNSPGSNLHHLRWLKKLIWDMCCLQYWNNSFVSLTIGDVVLCDWNPGILLFIYPGEKLIWIVILLSTCNSLRAIQCSVINYLNIMSWILRYVSYRTLELYLGGRLPLKCG